jgi:hypothetical protein
MIHRPLRETRSHDLCPPELLGLTGHGDSGGALKAEWGTRLSVLGASGPGTWLFGRGPPRPSRGDAALRYPHHRRVRERNGVPTTNSGECAVAPEQTLRTLQARRRTDYRTDICDFIFLSSFTISWRDRILTSFLSNLRSFLIKKNSYSWPHLQKQIDVPRVSADQDGPALGGH